MIKYFTVLFMLQISCIASAQQVTYTDGKQGWDEDSLGNHRAIVQFTGNNGPARVVIPWRRADSIPSGKRIIVQDAKTGQKVTNVKLLMANNEKGDLLFEPTSGKGDYYIYYLPYKNEGRANYPRGVYLQPENTASTTWLQSLPPSPGINTTTKTIQSIDAENSFYPMEVCATAGETATLIKKSARKDFILFPEDRSNPIKMTANLPYRWIQKGIVTAFTGQASRGEQYSFQIGLYAIQKTSIAELRFTALSNGKGQTIPAANLSCINTSGTDYKGQPFTKTIEVPAKQVQALWCLVKIPEAALAGIYKGSVTVHSPGRKPYTMAVILKVSDKVLPDEGISEPWKQTRLHWLNSTLFQENTVIEPYIPIRVNNSALEFLGRTVTLNADGLPKQVETYFTTEMTGYAKDPTPILDQPIHFTVASASGSLVSLPVSSNLAFTTKQAGTVSWTATSGNKQVSMQVQGSLEFDGFMTYNVKFTALEDLELSDIALQIPFKKEMARYMMGLGQIGSRRPAAFSWKWNVAQKNQDGAWIGAVNGGIQYSLRDENYSRPLNTNFYLQKPLHLPASWGNENKGGVMMAENSQSVLVNNYSGDRKLKKGDTVFYNFTLLITPFHPINTDFQWENRFFHKAAPIDTIKASGATVVNIHHANRINPWINYPFIEHRAMKGFIDSAHHNGLKVKIYNTVRELSDKAYETFPMRSLGHEIYSPGKGGGYSRLQEHLGKDYIAAWFVPEIKDAAIVNSGMSRWHNYYVEGMNWLTQNVGIDGIYLDDVAFDRITMKRIKRALTKDGHPGIIDLHSANQFNKNDGFNNSANLYLEHFPYLNRLWFGEYFDYEKNNPDFFLTEVSGIPFGLMGEMLEGGGNPWRGMVYGMTNRYPWSPEADPRNIWKAWDDFGMKGTSMIGYWSASCPVKTSDPNILATVYKKPGAVLVSIASWAESTTTVTLQIDWESLGMHPYKASITAPGIKNFQDAKSFRQSEPIVIEKNKGLIIIIKEG